MKHVIGVLTFVLFTSPAWAHSGGHGPTPDGTNAPPGSTRETAYGRPGDLAKVSREIAIGIDKGRCSPTSVAVKRGETARLSARNAGPAQMELAIGSASELKENAEMLRKFPAMQGAAPNRVRAKAGETATLVWQFSKAGEFAISCAAVGQFEAEGVAKLVVTP